MTKVSVRRYLRWSTFLLVTFIVTGCAQTQVTNNSGLPLDVVKVGRVSFSENLDFCGDGCSTGFKRVTRGNNKISLRQTPAAPWKSVGTLGPFKKKRLYSVNIKRQRTPGGIESEFCSELWRRANPDLEFNNDSAKTLVASRCTQPSDRPGTGFGPKSQVTNNSGTLLHMVKIGDDAFSENLAFCSDGCSTGFLSVASGDNQIMLQEGEGSAWQTLSEPLGPFDSGFFYSVNITPATSGGFCAELWKRGNTYDPFNLDPDKQLIESHCF